MDILCSKNLLSEIARFRSNTIAIVILLVSSMVLLGSCHRTERAYFPDGNPEYIIPKDCNKRIDGQAKWWYENGSLQIVADYKKGKLDGKVIRYYGNGMKQSEAEYRNDLLNGLSLDYNFNGKVIVEKNYRNDTLDGPCKQFDEQGRKIVEGNYKDGFFEGRWLYFSSDGTLVGEADFSGGTGSKVSWNERGEVIGRASYQANLRHGDEIWYDAGGNITRVRTFNEGEIVSDSTYSQGNQ